MTLRVFEAFAGVGSQRMALRNLGIDHEIVAIAEIDKFAIKSYEAIHGETNNLGDISQIKTADIPDHDLFTYSFPCQDISVAGRGLGLDEGSDTRSGLLWECQKVIAVKKPKYLLLENVKNLVGKKHKHNFDKWLEWLEEQGYTNYHEILNAKDFGVPQNRERVFVVSILGEHEPYEFPEPVELELRLKDVLEDEVDEKFYLSEEKTQQLVTTVSKKHSEKTVVKMNRNEVKGESQLANTLLARDYKGFGNQDMNGVIEPKAERIGGIFDKDSKQHQAGAVWDKEQLSPTLDTMQGGWRQPSVVVAKEEYGRMGRQAVETLNDNDVKHGDTVNPFGKRVSSKNGISPTLTTRPEGFKTAVLAVVDSIELPAIGTSRGRQPHVTETIKGYKAGGGRYVPMVNRIGGIFDKDGKTHQAGSIFDKNGLAPTLDTMQGGYAKPSVLIKNATKKGYLETTDGDGVVEPLGTIYAGASERFQRGLYSGLSRTLKASNYDTSVVFDNFRIRKLTPKECWRLMGFSDDDFHKAEEVNSNTQLYKQAGNSIVVDVLEAIFKQLLED